LQPVRIRQVKREIRVLGVAAAVQDGSTRVVGVVFRGARWLDGVMSAESADVDLTRTIIDMVNSSPHRKQVRVIMLHSGLMPDGSRVDAARIFSETSKPVIVLDMSLGAMTDPSMGHLTWGRGVNAVDVAYIGLRERDVEAILRVSTGGGPTPEALRVAELIIRALQAPLT
jgi:endonuclease V-like protein UPF0215 family